MSAADGSVGGAAAPRINLALIAGFVAAGQFASLVFAPAFAPLVGGVTATLGGHRAPFEITVLFGLILAAFAFAAMPETHDHIQRAPLVGQPST